MESALDALPDHPLTAEDVATINESAERRVIPYTWYGEQVIAVLLAADPEDPLSDDGATVPADEGEEARSGGDPSPGGGEMRGESAAPEEGPTETTTQATDESAPGGVEIVDGSMAPARGTGTAANEDGSDGADEADTGRASGRGAPEAVGTVEVIGADGAATDEEGGPSRGSGDGPRDGGNHPGGTAGAEPSRDLEVYAAGYDDGRAAWVTITEIDPDLSFAEVEPVVRDWLTDTYPDDVVSRLAVGPAEL